MSQSEPKLPEAGPSFQRCDREGPCYLCGTEGERQLSHVVPSLFYKALKATSATGHMRMAHTPNRRVQGGFKDYLLCKGCEQKFAKWERTFEMEMLRPNLADGGLNFRYGPYFAKFATSLTWRHLLFQRVHASEFQHKVIKNWSATDEAERVWREFLLDNRRHPGIHEQHVFVFDEIVESTRRMPPYMHRYLLRSIDTDVPANSTNIVVYVKALNWLFIGLVMVPDTKWWKGSRIAPTGGVLMPGTVTWPDQMWEWIQERADIKRVAISNLSAKQQQLINDAALSDPERVVHSHSFRAFRYDKTPSRG